MSADARSGVSQQLQAVVTGLIDLSLAAKQAHWNLVGPNFKAVHEQLDEVVETFRAHSDELAERMITLGTPPDGRVQFVAESTSLEPMPTGKMSDTDALRLIAARVAAFLKTARDAQGTVADPDPISEDMLITMIAEVEKHHWMLTSLLQTA
ncbi:MAG: DNA starvation/stationary phase protection protein [Planctomycetota bacterium]